MTCARPRIEDIARASQIMEVKITTTELIDLPIAPANTGALVRFCYAVHDKLRREIHTVSLDRAACVGQDIQAGLVSPDDSHFTQDLKRRLVHCLDVFVGQKL